MQSFNYIYESYLGNVVLVLTSHTSLFQPAAPSSEPQEAVQTKEKRNHFKEQVLQTVKSKATTPEPAKSAPHAPAQKTPQTSTPVKVSQPATAPVKSSPQPPSAPVKLITPVEIKKPVSTPAAPVKSATDPAKTVTPKSILPRTSSQTDDKTPEKQGFYILHNVHLGRLKVNSSVPFFLV